MSANQSCSTIMTPLSLSLSLSFSTDVEQYSTLRCPPSSFLFFAAITLSLSMFCVCLSCSLSLWLSVTLSLSLFCYQSISFILPLYVRLSLYHSLSIPPSHPDTEREASESTFKSAVPTLFSYWSD